MLNSGLNKEQLALLANIVQIFNYVENTQQTSNDRIVLELQRQNEIYFGLLIKLNKEILKKLEKLSKHKEESNVRLG